MEKILNVSRFSLPHVRKKLIRVNLYLEIKNIQFDPSLLK